MIDLYGSYCGSLTNNGSSTTCPVSLPINTVGWTFTGTTTEGSSTYSDTGTIMKNGSITIDEGGPALSGGVTGYNQLSGAWSSPGGANGPWTVNALLD